jgi:hypothetical protein
MFATCSNFNTSHFDVMFSKNLMEWQKVKTLPPYEINKSTLSVYEFKVTPLAPTKLKKPVKTAITVEPVLATVKCYTCNCTTGIKGKENYCNMCDHYF